MRGMQLSISHCPRISLSLLVALGMMLTGSVSAQAASATQPPANSTGDLLREDVAKNWNLPPGMEGARDVRVRVHLRLSRGGEIVGEPKVTVTGGPKGTRQAMAAAAIRAVLRAAPFKNLPMDQYDTWKEVTLNFAPAL